MADTADLNPDFMHRLNLLIQASGGAVYVVSGYRDEARQQQLWDAAVKKYGSAEAARKWAPPGHSNHEKGIAADLGGDLKLAHDLAPSVGLYFPMSHENWHVEPVGSRSSSSPLAYTPPPDVPAGQTPVPQGENLHDVGTQIGNYMASIMGSPQQSDPTLDPSSAAFGVA